MSFLDHLDELRKRLTHAIVALLVGFVAPFAFAGRAQEFVMKPLMATLPPGDTFVYTEPGEQFFLFIKIAAIVGLLIASPYVMLAGLAVRRPGPLRQREEAGRAVRVLLERAVPGRRRVLALPRLPDGVPVLRQLLDDAGRFMPRIAPVFSMYAWLLLAMGVMFQLPMLVMVLARLGLVTAGFLARNIKYAVLIIFVVAAVASPGGDPVSQTVTAAPMLVLYVISIGVAWIFQKRRTTTTRTRTEQRASDTPSRTRRSPTAGLSQRTHVPGRASPSRTACCGSSPGSRP